MTTRPNVSELADVTCSITWSKDRTVCGGAPAIPVIGICVHEHVEQANACPGHFGGVLYCQQCLDAPGGLAHQCEMAVTRAAEPVR